MKNTFKIINCKYNVIILYTIRHFKGVENKGIQINISKGIIL